MPFVAWAKRPEEPSLRLAANIYAGVDYALTDKFVVGAQYRYYDFGSEHFDTTDPSLIVIRM